jgi:vacuolar-type H+-ATPase subunit E/Vma4
MKDLEEAARKTAEYLYNIDGEVTPEIYEAIGRLRQLINEEFKPEKSVSSQLIYSIMNPAIEAYIAEQRREAVDEYVENVARHARGERLDHLSKKGAE